MGRVVKKKGDNVTKYYWYPGEKKDWVRAAIAAGSGGAVALFFGLLSNSALLAALLGTAVTAGVGGLYFGRRDAHALHNLPEFGAARKAAVADSGRAAWRALVKGFGAAAAAVLVANMPPASFVADWVLPIVPAIVGAVTHQAGMVYERLAQIGSVAVSKEAPTVTKEPGLEHKPESVGV